jgi:hypothetical protein
MPGRGEQVRSPAGRNRPRRVAGVFVALATLFYFVAGKVTLRDSKLRYELTIEVETPAGMRRGSSVIEAVIHRTVPFWGDNGIHFKLLGEAPVVDLPDGRMLFALLHDSTNVFLPERAAVASNAMPALSDEILRGANKVGKFWPDLKLTRPELVIDAAMFEEQSAQSYPDLVVIDPADLASIRAVDPRASEQVLGAGIRFARMRLAFVDAPPMTSLDRRAPWVLGISQKLDRIAAASGPLRHSLNPSRFIARN